MKTRLDETTIALRAARELQDGDYVNLGMGIPQLVATLIPEGKRIFFHTENGCIGYGRPRSQEEINLQDPTEFDYVDAGGAFFTHVPGMAFFDHAMSFAMIRGGHLDATILGGMQVSETGDLANWKIPEMPTGNFGGAADLALKARKTIVCMEHVTKKGEKRILKKCTYDLTAKGCVKLIITDIAVIEVTSQGLLLKEVAPGWTAQEIQEQTDANLNIARDLKEISL